MKYDLMLYKRGQWAHHRYYRSSSEALADYCMQAGKVLMGHYEEGTATMRITDKDGVTVACVREIPEPREIAPGTAVAVGGKDADGYALGPLKRWHGLTWVGWLNFILLRWFLFRICYQVETDGSVSKYSLKFVPTWRW